VNCDKTFCISAYPLCAEYKVYAIDAMYLKVALDKQAILVSLDKELIDELKFKKPSIEAYYVNEFPY
jgi:predicted nucleic acid-binding protein